MEILENNLVLQLRDRWITEFLRYTAKYSELGFWSEVTVPARRDVGASVRMALWDHSLMPATPAVVLAWQWKDIAPRAAAEEAVTFVRNEDDIAQRHKA